MTILFCFRYFSIADFINSCVEYTMRYFFWQYCYQTVTYFEEASDFNLAIYFFAGAYPPIFPTVFKEFGSIISTLG